MKKFIEEFKEFINRGNVMGLAVGVIIGGAFSAIINSLVNDIIQPIIGIFGGADFKDYYLDLGGPQLKYGNFITAVINFLIMALVVFILVKIVTNATNRFKKETEVVVTTKKCPYCKSEIDIEATRCPHCTSVVE